MYILNQCILYQIAWPGTGFLGGIMLVDGDGLVIEAESGELVACCCNGTRCMFGFIGLGPGGLILRSRTSLAELLRLFPPGVGMLAGRWGPPPYGPGDIERCWLPLGPGAIGRGLRPFGDGEPRPLAGEAGRCGAGPIIPGGGGPRGPGPRAPGGGRGLTGRAERQVRGATPC